MPRGDPKPRKLGGPIDVLTSVQFVLLFLRFADLSAAHLQTGCGGAQWRELREAVDAYCREKAAPSEQLGCRVAHYSFEHCAASPRVQSDGAGALRGNIPDPRDRSYAWLLDFKLRRHKWTLERFVYQYDDCDAAGIPAPPQGPLHLEELRHDASRD
jgi:hypothetical protein